MSLCVCVCVCVCAFLIRRRAQQRRQAGADVTATTRAGSGALHLLVKYGATNRQSYSKATYIKLLRQVGRGERARGYAA